MGFIDDIEDMARRPDAVERDKRLDGPTASEKIFKSGLRGLEGIMRIMDNQDMRKLQDDFERKQALRQKQTHDAKDTIDKSRRKLSDMNFDDDLDEYDDFEL